jgi:hypothetical protein
MEEVHVVVRAPGFDQSVVIRDWSLGSWKTSLFIEVFIEKDNVPVLEVVADQVSIRQGL